MSPPTEDQIRSEFGAWLAEAWDPDIGLTDWRERLVASGWAVPSWSREWYGRGLPAWADTIVIEQLRAAGAVGAPLGAGMSLAAPTLATHASDELKRRVLRPTLTGELTWCQLFSEPSAGSDLAGMKAADQQPAEARAALPDRGLAGGQRLRDTRGRLLAVFEDGVQMNGSCLFASAYSSPPA